jgi:dihydroflavonol-4-reductase
VGTAVVRALVEAGRPVVSLARSARSRARLEALGAHAVDGDVLDRGSLVAGMRGCEVAFHVAGRNAACLVRDPSPLYAVNVTGSRNVIDAAAKAGVRRVVYTSSAAAVGESRHETGREDGTHRGWFLSDYERSKFDAERAVLSRAATTGVEVVCVNPASVQGPGRDDATTKVLVAVLTGRLRVTVHARMSLVDIADCARGHLLAEVAGTPGERYILCGANLDVAEALALVSEVTGVTVRPRFVPRGVVSAAGALAEGWGRLLRRDSPVCREVVRTLLHGHAYDGSKAARELALSYTPVEETLRRTVAWLVERNLVPAAGGPAASR